jgi:hypothetical protein
MDLDGEVRQRAEPRKLRPVVVRSTRLARVDGHYRPEVARSQPPEMKARDFVAITLDRLSRVVRHGTIRVNVQQDSPCVTDQALHRPRRYLRVGPSKAIRTYGRAADPQSPAPTLQHRRLHEYVLSRALFVFLKDERMLVASDAQTRYE